MLNQEFINVWILSKNLEPLAKQAASPNIREWAAKLENDYTFPVDSIIYTPDGQKLTNVATNELIWRGDMNTEYLKFLESGLKAWVGITQ